jgi:hypothetical protein
VRRKKKEKDEEGCYTSQVGFLRRSVVFELSAVASSYQVKGLPFSVIILKLSL